MVMARPGNSRGISGDAGDRARSADLQSAVSRICNPQGVAGLKGLDRSGALPNAIRRYGRFKICATSFPLVLSECSVIQGAMSDSFRIGVLGSGKGSNFVALADAIAARKIPAQVGLVLSDAESAGILQHARERNI